MDEKLRRKSKYLSYILRHHPESIGLNIDHNGWASVKDLIRLSKKDGKQISIEDLEKIIEESNKKRFVLSDDKSFIRAGYGHSIDIDLDLIPQNPPKMLFHGTAKQNVEDIMEDGILPGSRNFVHMSDNRNDAITVGSRHGVAVVMMISAYEMYEDGHTFYRSPSEKDIWLTPKVPPKYLFLDKFDS